MILSSITQVIRAYLTGAPTTTNPDWSVSWADHNTTTHAFVPDHADGVLNGASPTTIQAAPSAGFQRQTKHISFHNLDTANVTVIVDLYNGSVARRWYQALLKPNWTLEWDGIWRVYDEYGVEQEATGAGASGLVVEEVDGTPTYSSVTKIQFDQADGFALSEPVAGTVRVDLTAAGVSDQSARLLGFYAWFNRGL